MTQNVTNLEKYNINAFIDIISLFKKTIL